MLAVLAGNWKREIKNAVKGLWAERRTVSLRQLSTLSSLSYCCYSAASQRHYTAKCGLLLPAFRGLRPCLCVGRAKTCKNCRTDRHAVRDMDSSGPRKTCVRRRSRSPAGEGSFLVGWGGMSGRYSEYAASAMQKQLNRPRCSLAYGVGGPGNRVLSGDPGQLLADILGHARTCRRSTYSTLVARGQQRCGIWLAVL